MKTIFTAFAAAFMLASTNVPAAAIPVSVAISGQGQQNMPVKTGDLNLASEEGQKTLALRIHRAARTMCASEAVDQLLQNIRAERQCIKEATSRALASVTTNKQKGGPVRSRPFHFSR